MSAILWPRRCASRPFRRVIRWAAHDVRFHVSGVKHFHHPIVGEITLDYERLELAADSGLAIMTYTAEPGSKSRQSLRLLRSWAAASDQPDATPAADEP